MKEENNLENFPHAPSFQDLMRSGYALQNAGSVRLDGVVVI